MALVSCPECGGSVSSFATTCPHCGHPLTAASSQVTNSQPTQKVDSPAPSASSPLSTSTITVSSASFGRIMMLLLGIVTLIMLSVYRGQGDHVSYDFSRAAYGFANSFLALFFLIQLVKPGTKDIQRPLAFLCFGLTLFVEIASLLPFDYDRIWLYENMNYFSAAAGLVITLYSLTLNNFSKYIGVTAGIIWTAYASMGFLLGSGISSGALIVLCVIGGLCFLGMLANWTLEATTTNNNLYVRIASALMVMIILATVVVVAVKVKDVLNGRWHNPFDAYKLIMGFVLASGMASLFFSVLTNRNGFLRFVSALFASMSLFVLLGYYPEYYMGDGLIEVFQNIYFTHLFFIPIFVMSVYAAAMTDSLKDKFIIVR